MIDIILATHNGEKYLKNLIDSILYQTVTDFRIIVGDDNSDDSTKEMLKNYSVLYPEKFILHFFNYNISSAKANFFRLIDYSDADYIMFADQDDVWKKDKIEISLAAIKNAETNKKPVLVHTDLVVVDKDLGIINNSLFEMQQLPKKWDQLNRLIAQNNVTGCTVMFNRYLRDIIKYKNIDNIIMHDWWLALIASVFGKIVFIDESTVFYRQHFNNEVGAKNVQSVKYLDNRLKNTDGIKNNILATYIQCNEFLYVYGDRIDLDKRMMLKRYASLNDAGFIKRFFIINKYNFKKNTTLRKIGQIIWG